VHQVLINEKYIGNNVWNRGSFKLKKKRIRNSHMWIRADGVFEPLIDRALFEAARAIITDRSKKLTNEEMLAALHRLLER
jgi:choline kinase